MSGVLERRASKHETPPVATGSRPFVGIGVQLLSPEAWRTGVVESAHRFDCFDNVRHVELWFEEAPGRSYLSRVANQLGEIACTIHAPFVDFSLTSSDTRTAQASERRLNKTLEVADYLGAQAVALHPGPWPVYEEKTKVMERFAKRYAKAAASTGVPIGVENLKPKSSGVQRTLVQDMDDIRLLLAMEPASRFTVDVGHALQTGISPVAMIDEVGESAALIHLHDVDANGGSHSPLGSGRLSSADIRQIFRAAGNTPVTLELLNDDDYVASLRVLDDANGEDERLDTSPVIR